MSKNYAKKASRSRRKPPRELDVEATISRANGDPTVQLTLPISQLLLEVRSAIEQTAADAGLLVMRALIDEEVEQVVGAKGKHDPDRTHFRWGQEDTNLVFAGRKVPFKRPRVRKVGGREVGLERFRFFQGPSALEGSVARKVIAGVSMRDYEHAIDAVCDGYGIQKSSVSRHWKAISASRLAEFSERPLGDLNLVAIVIDGIEFHKNLLVVALGVDAEARKHVLGLWQGTTENSEITKCLLEDLLRRGLVSQRRYLFIVDGAKALSKAVRQVFGDRAEIQRCQVHKERNVLEHLSKEYQRVVRLRLRAVWGLVDYKKAKSDGDRLVRYLKDLNPSAARSLEEGFEETLTLHRLGVPEVLRRSLRSTNAIESCFSSTRKYCRNVKRWKAGDMVTRWAGTMLIEAEKRFRCLKGHRSMPKLLATLGHVIDQVKALG